MSPRYYFKSTNLKWNSRQKSNQGFICDWISLKLLYKSTIIMKEALLRFTVISFSGKLIFSGVQGHFYARIKIAIFKTLRHNMKLYSYYHQGLYTWTQALRTLFVYAEFTKKKVFGNSPLELDLRRVTIMADKKCRSCVGTLVILRAKFHAVSSLLSVLKIVILMLACQCPMQLIENEYVNLESASFVIIMHLQEGLTHIQSQIKPWLLFGESFTFNQYTSK